MNSEVVDEFEIKTEIEIEDWKPADVSELGITSSDQIQNQSLDSHLNLNEIKNSNNFFDISKGL